MVSAAMMPMIGYPPGGLQAPIPQGGGAGGVAAVQPSPTQPACAVPGWGGPIPPPHPHSMGISPTGMGVPPPMMMMMQLMTTSDRHPKPHHQLRQVAASPTAHLHEILGISASRSRATSEGVGASGGQETPVSPESARADKPSLSAARVRAEPTDEPTH